MDREAKRVFNDIKKLLISPPVLKAPTPDGLFLLESNTSREGVGGTLLQKQGDEWVVIGYHSKRLPKSAKNFGVRIRIRIDRIISEHPWFHAIVMQ